MSEFDDLKRLIEEIKAGEVEYSPELLELTRQAIKALEEREARLEDLEKWAERLAQDLVDAGESEYE